MADKNDKKKEKDENHEPPIKKLEKAEKFSETLQYIGILGAIVMGLRPPPKPGEEISGEKQVPGWIISSFPSFTDEDEVEYNLTLSSLPKASKSALEKFEENLKIEGIYDEVKLRVLLVKIRREFMERMKNPSKKNEAEHLLFEKLTLRDAIKDFAKRLSEEEKVVGRTPEETFGAQKKIAINLKLIEKKSFLKKCSEHKITTLAGIILLPIGFFQLLFWLLN